jgi:sugar phosphate permease
VIVMAGLINCVAIAGIALSPADNIPLAVILLVVGGFTITMAPFPALGVDLVGRRLAGTATGMMSLHGYIYGGFQAWFFGWLSLAAFGGWTWVFAVMAAARLISVAAIRNVKA